MKWKFLLIATILLLVYSLFSTEKKKKLKFAIFSKSFQSGHVMPLTLASYKVKGGKNKSPSLYWENIPEGTKSLALICIDTHPIAKRWVHWMVVNIPVSSDHIIYGGSLKKMPEGSVELYNSFGDTGWGGPQPPKGTGMHKYLFKIYALKTGRVPGDIKNEKEFNAAVKKMGILGKASCIGLFRQD